MEKDKLEPKLRFPGFTEPWEQRKLNEVISRFIVPMRDKPKSFDGNIPWTRIEDIEGNEISRSLTNQNVSEETVEKMNLRIIPKDSLIVSASATFGVTAFVKANLITNQTFIGLVPNDNIDLGFLYYSFNAPSLRTQMKMESAGSTIFYIPQDRFKEMVISLPNIKEQYKLAKLFSDLDKLITLHQRKEEELQKLKKGLLQKMFPKDGESVPEIRFPNFTDSWEHRKLATIATFAKGRGYSKNDLTDRGTPLILYGRLYTNYSSAIETVDTYAKPLIGSVYSKGGEVIVPASGETAEDIARASAVISKGFLLGGDLNIINPNSEIDPVFLALQLSNGYLKKELASKAQGKSVVHIHNSDLENLQIIYPSLVEQMKVSTCIRVFEHLITLHHRKTEELKKLKKALLQQMFV